MFGQDYDSIMKQFTKTQVKLKALTERLVVKTAKLIDAESKERARHKDRMAALDSEMKFTDKERQLALNAIDKIKEITGV